MTATYPNWTEREDDIVRALYPDLGARGTMAAMRSEHFIRTEGAIKERAKHLGVKRDRSKIRRRVETAWTEEELDVIKSSFPLGGASMVKAQLDALGYSRTVGAINTRAAILGLRMKNTKRRMTKGGKKVIVNLCMDEVLDSDIIEVLNGQRNRSQYVRELVKRDMAGK